MMSTILDCSRCGKEYKYSEIDEHECADVVVLRARIALLEKVAEWACVRLGIVNDPAYSGYTHDLCGEVIAELRRKAKEG